MNLDEIILSAHGFAEVMPEHKFEIVQRLREQGYVVGMTGALRRCMGERDGGRGRSYRVVSHHTPTTRSRAHNHTLAPPLSPQATA